jgi:hypothetical protein
VSKLVVKWHDHGLWPELEPDTRYPMGVDLDISRGAPKTCSAELPYPAKRCGHYEITCPSCGLRVAATTAGRKDDPRSIRVACKLQPAKI